MIVIPIYLAVNRPIIDCGPPESTENGRVTALWGTTVGSFAWYFCNSGYELVGAEMRTCTVSGDWEPQLPICERKNDHMTLMYRHNTY